MIIRELSIFLVCSGFEESTQRLDEVQKRLEGEIEAMHGQNDQAIAEIRASLDDSQRALDGAFEDLVQSTTQQVHTHRRSLCPETLSQPAMGHHKHPQVDESLQTAQNISTDLRSQIASQAEQLDLRIMANEKRMETLASKLTLDVESHERDLVSKLGTAEMELSDMVQTLDAKFESLNFTLGTRLDNEMMVMKQRVDGAIEGVWSRLETHLGDIKENLRRDTTKVCARRLVKKLPVRFALILPCAAPITSRSLPWSNEGDVYLTLRIFSRSTS
eukprot:SAG11_NODE_1443_length_4894_cov_20.162044_3_plen_274_part_00